jgi:hypothetical protein
VQEVHGHRLRLGARPSQDPGGVGVERRAFARGQSAHDRISHERVLELQWARITQDPTADQLLGDRRRRLPVQARQPRTRDERRPVEHRHGASEPSRPVPQAGEGRGDRRGERIGTDPRHRSDIGADTAIAKPVNKPPEQKRVAARRAVARLDERGGHRRAVALRQHRSSRIPRQGDELERGRKRSAAERDVLRRHGRPPGRKQQHRERVEPVREELEEAHRGAVRPLQVVDDEQLRALVRQRGHQPVETMEHAERRIDVAIGTRPARQDDRPGQRGRAGKRPATQLHGHAAQSGLEQLPHDAPRVGRLEIGPARAAHREPAPLSRIPRHLKDARFPDPRRPLHHQHAASSRCRRVERIDDGPRLAIALMKATRHARRESMSAASPLHPAPSGRARPSRKLLYPPRD